MTTTEAGLYDKIAFSIAKEVGFDCYKKALGEYAFRSENRKTQSPPLVGISAGPNPCYEVPLGYYEIYVTIEGSKLTLHKVLIFDLNEPDSLDKIKDEFSDLNRLRDRIKKAEEEAFMERNGEPGFTKLAKATKARNNHYKKLSQVPWILPQKPAS